jgi:serine/threonine protein kinase
MQRNVRPRVRYCTGCERAVSSSEVCAPCTSVGRPASIQADRMIGRVVAGRWRITSRLGAGGFGVVFEVLDLQTHRRGAMKLPRPGTSLRNRGRMLAEAELARRVPSAAIAKLLAAGRDGDGTEFVVSELAPGVSLEQIAARAPHPAVEAARIVAAIAGAVETLHQARVVHRDLKPSNVFIDGERVTLLDLGAARSMDSMDRARLTAIGSPAYMAPEQRSGDPIDERADVYALGVILVELATARRQVDTALALLPAGLAELARAMAAPSPDDRPASMRRVRAKLRRFAANTRGSLENEAAATDEHTVLLPNLLHGALYAHARVARAR